MRRRNPRFKVPPLAVKVAVVAGGVWLAYLLGKKLLAKLGAAGDKVTTGAANALEWFFPLDIGETLYYAVKFPDGAQHAIPSRSVSSDGVFTYKGDGKRYRMAVNKAITSGVNKVAIPL